MEERDLPLCQAKCRVGNGNEISINHPNWFPIAKSNKKLCPQQIDKVSDLIDEEQKFWKFNLVFQFYSQEHAQIIHQILLCKRTNAPDQLIWPNSKTGQYNVKECYHLLYKQSRKCNDANPGQVIFMVGVLFKESAYTCTQILKSAFNVDLITINVHYLKLTKLAYPATINLPPRTLGAVVTPQI